MNRVVKYIFLLGVTYTLTGCYLETFVGGGGEIRSSSGTRDCDANSVCRFKVSDFAFSDSFIAMPKSGYTFSHWKNGNGYLCGNSTNPICSLSNEEFAENPGVEAFLASDESFYIMPVFELARTDAGLGVVVGTDPNDSSKSIIIGPLVGRLDSTSTLMDVHVNFRGKRYYTFLRNNWEARYPSEPVYSDPVCNDLIGSRKATANRIGHFSELDGGAIWTIDVLTPIPDLGSKYYKQFSSSSECYPWPELGPTYTAYPVTIHSDATESEVLNGAVAPFKVVLPE